MPPIAVLTDTDSSLLLDLAEQYHINEKMVMLERIRTQGKAWTRVIELAIEAAGGCAVDQLAILHVNAPEAARQFELLARAALTFPPEMRHVEMTPCLSIQTGPGLVGIVLVTKE